MTRAIEVGSSDFDATTNADAMSQVLRLPQ